MLVFFRVDVTIEAVGANSRDKLIVILAKRLVAVAKRGTSFAETIGHIVEGITAE